MKKNVSYLDLARRHSVLMALIQHGTETWLSTDVNVEAREKLVCEDLPIKHSEIPQEDVYKALAWLQERANKVEQRKKQLELQEFDDEDPDDDFDYEDDLDGEESTSSGGQEEDGAAGAKGEGAPGKGNEERSRRGKRAAAPA